MIIFPSSRFVVALFVSSMICSSASAAIVDFRSGGNLGSLAGFDLNDSPPQTFSIPGFSSLSITFESISSSSAGARINSNADRFGVDSTGSGSGTDDSDEFESSLLEIATFSFNQAVRITELDFVSFDDNEEFQFAGLTIAGTAMNLNGFDVLDLSSSPIVLAADQSFSMQATSGSIGFQNMNVTAVPEPSALLIVAGFGFFGALKYRRRRRKLVISGEEKMVTV